MIKTVKQIIPSQLVNMGGIILDQPLPYRGVDQIDPFLLIHHWSNRLSGGKKQKDLGVGPHPHRGFSPVTFVFKGGVHHQDSMGNSSEVFANGVQWMNSGKGVIHSERPVKELAEYGGDFEIIQLWINTPIKNKMDEPQYIPLHKKDIPYWDSGDGSSMVHVVSGEFKGLKGPIESFSELQVFRLELKKGAKLTVTAPKTHNTILYLLNGETIVNKERSIPNDLVVFSSDGEDIEILAREDANAIFLSGEPLDEPIFAHGPFVMGSYDEIEKAIEAYQDGRMGHLLEKFD